MQNADRFTIITIVAVLIACIVAIIAILRITWNIAGENISSAFADLSEPFQRPEQVDYGFEVPDTGIDAMVEDATGEFTGVMLDENEQIDYGFTVSNADNFNTFNFYDDPIVLDALKAERQIESNSNVIDTSLRRFGIVIPIIGLDSDLWQGFGADTLLRTGMWIHPNSAETIDDGAIIALCTKAAFPNSDPRSCSYLDNLDEGDSIYLVTADEVFVRYEVKGLKLYALDIMRAYSRSSEQAIKIVTTPDRRYADQRLVIYAERVD